MSVEQVQPNDAMAKGACRAMLRAETGNPAAHHTRALEGEAGE